MYIGTLIFTSLNKQLVDDLTNAAYDFFFYVIINSIIINRLIIKTDKLITISTVLYGYKLS